jgi:hypothetical protein
MDGVEQGKAGSVLARFNAAQLAGAAGYGAAITLLELAGEGNVLMVIDAENIDEATEEVAAYILARDVLNPETVWRQFHGTYWDVGSTAGIWPEAVDELWALALDVFTQTARITGKTVQAKQDQMARLEEQARQQQAATPPKVSDTIFERHGSAFERTDAFKAGMGQPVQDRRDMEAAHGGGSLAIDAVAQDEAAGPGLTIGAVEHEAEAGDVEAEATGEAGPTKAEKRENRKNKNQR